MGLHVDMFSFRNMALFVAAERGNVLDFLSFVFEVGNYLQGGLSSGYLVLPLIFVGSLLFELWERSGC